MEVKRIEKKKAIDAYRNYLKTQPENCDWLGKWDGKKFVEDNFEKAIVDQSVSLKKVQSVFPDLRIAQEYLSALLPYLTLIVVNVFSVTTKSDVNGLLQLSAV